VELEDVKTVVDAKPVIDVLKKSADNGSQESDHGSEPRVNITSSRSNTDKTSNGTLASTNNREATLVTDGINKNPTKDTSRGSNLGVEGSHHTTNGSVKSTSTVEAEPTKDNEDGADKHEGRVVRLVFSVMILGGSLAESQSVSKSGPTRCDVNGTATSLNGSQQSSLQSRTRTYIVERRKVEEPAIGVPCPASDRAVDNGAPAEGEDEGRQNATTLESTTDDNLYCASGEEKLIKTEDDLRKDSTARRGSSGNISQAEVGHVADEGAGSATEGKTVTPEHPLESHDGTDHHTLEE